MYIWGFTTKSNIESIFSIQKKGIRAVIPGFVNYFYRDGEVPHHTKTAFTKYVILTVHNIIAKNTLIFMCKHHRQNETHALPDSVASTIHENAPKPGSTHETNQDWHELYCTNHFRTSLFYKGPLLFADFATNELLSLISLLSFKSHTKRLLTDIQSSGDYEEWQTENFKLYNIPGLRKSNRNIAN